MRGFENEMFVGIDDLAFVLGIAAPKHKDEILPVLGELLDGGVGEFFPTLFLVGTSLVSDDGKGSIEQQNSLFGPVSEVAGLGDGFVDVGFEFFEDV